MNIIMSERRLAKALLSPKVKFAWLPVYIKNQQKFIFWKHYYRAPVGVWVDDCDSGRQLYQYREGGSSMDGEGGKYNVHRNFELYDNSWFTVDYFNNSIPLKEFLQKKIEGKYVPGVTD